MSRRGRCVRVDTGIWRDAGGYRVQATANTRQKETRFPPDAALRDMQAWQDRTRVKLRGTRKRHVSGPSGTLAGDVVRYLREIKHQANYKSRRAEFRAWTDALGNLTDRAQIDRTAVRQVISDWLAAGVAPATVRNRRNALAALYHALDGEDAPSPTDRVKVSVPKKRPAYVSVEVVRRVEANLRAQEQSRTGRKPVGRLRTAQTRARFMVMASTGVRPAQLKRVQPADVDLERRTWQIAGTKGGEPIGLWLNEDMLAAWTLFVQSDAWGPFNTRSMARVLRTAGWPKGIRPYNVRHAVGQDLAEQGEDYDDIAAWLGHSDVATTKAFYVPILNSRLRRMSERLSGRLGWTVPGVVPGAPRQTSQNLAISRHERRARRTAKRADSA